MLKDLREITFAACHFMPKYLECLSISTLCYQDFQIWRRWILWGIGMKDYPEFQKENLEIKKNNKV